MTTISIGKIVYYVSNTDNDNARKELLLLIDKTKKTVKETQDNTNRILFKKINNVIKKLSVTKNYLHTRDDMEILALLDEQKHNVRKERLSKQRGDIIIQLNTVNKSITSSLNFNKLSDRKKAIEALNVLKNDIEMSGVNIYGIEFEISELSNTLSAFVLKQMRAELRGKTKNEDGEDVSIESFTAKYTEDKNKARELLSAELETINPVHLFILFDFIADASMKQKIMETLDTTDKLLPKNVDLFDEINIKPTTTRITGTTVQHTFPRSEENKAFAKLEEDFLNSVNISDFRFIPLQILDKYRKKIFEMNTIFNIINKFNTGKNTNKGIEYPEEWIHIFVNIFNEFLGAVPQNAKKPLAKFILRALDVYALKATIKDDALLEHQEQLDELFEVPEFGDSNEFFDNSEDLAEALM